MIGGGLLFLDAAAALALAYCAGRAGALMAGTVLVNITPPNPYSDAAMAAWQQGHSLISTA